MTPSSDVVVLVVEDEILTRMSIADHLTDCGFTVLEATDADQAIAILNTRPDVRILFTDIDMPGSMDGLKLAAAVRDRWPPVKIVVTSGHHRLGPGQIPAESLFFRKPYNPEMLVATFREISAL